MVLIRLAYAADLPPPADLVRRLDAAGAATAAAPSPPNAPAPPAPPTPTADNPRGSARPPDAAPAPPSPPEPSEPPESEAPPEFEAPADLTRALRGFEEIVALFEERREGVLTTHLRQDVHLVRFAPGRIEFRPGERAPRDLANRVGQLLSQWTGRRWIVSVTDTPGTPGAPTLAEQAQAEEQRRLAEAERHPLVQAVKEAFPGARVARVTKRTPPAADEGKGENQA